MVEASGFKLPELVDPEGYYMDEKFRKCLEKGELTFSHLLPKDFCHWAVGKTLCKRFLTKMICRNSSLSWQCQEIRGAYAFRKYAAAP